MSMLLPARDSAIVSSVSRLQRCQQTVAAQYASERARQLQRAASGCIFGHMPGQPGPSLYSSTSSPNLMAPSAGRASDGAKRAPNQGALAMLAGTLTPPPISQRGGPTKPRHQQEAKTHGSHGRGKHGQGSTPKRQTSSSSSQKGKSTGPQKRVSEEPPPEIDLLLDGIRARFRDRGITSVSQIEGEFEEMDHDGSGCVSSEEFLHGMVSRGILRSNREADAVFRYFDSDESGSIDLREFAYMVKGALNPKRRAIVHQAFRLLDRTGDGVITIDDLVQAFDVANSLDVMSGSRSKEEAMREFLSLFDTVNSDGKVTLAEFERYYEDIGALITSDDYFVMMVQNAWHLEGAHGGHCLRVMVTDSYGRGKVVEVREDVGLNRQSPRFPEKLRNILADRYGVTDVEKFEILGRY